MEQGPLPPHERTWRHPSELAADESARVRADTGPRAARIAALGVGTVGLLAVGLLAFAVTPQRGGAPMAGGRVSSLVAPSALGSATTLLLETAVTELTEALGIPTPTAGDRRDTPPPSAYAPASTLAGTVGASVSLTTVADDELVLATPLENGLALVTAQSVVGRAEGDPITLRFASGLTTDGQIVGTFGMATVVAVGELPDESPRRVAAAPPTGDAMVTVLLDSPVEVPLSELATLDAPEGTPVIDADGSLVGLCTHTEDGATDLAVADPAAEEFVPDTEPTAPSSTAAPATQPPPTSPPPPSTTVATTVATAPSTSTTSSTTSTTAVATTTTVNANR